MAGKSKKKRKEKASPLEEDFRKKRVISKDYDQFMQPTLLLNTNFKDCIMSKLEAGSEENKQRSRRLLLNVAF